MNNARSRRRARVAWALCCAGVIGFGTVGWSRSDAFEDANLPALEADAARLVELRRLAAEERAAARVFADDMEAQRMLLHAWRERLEARREALDELAHALADRETDLIRRRMAAETELDQWRETLATMTPPLDAWRMRTPRSLVDVDRGAADEARRNGHTAERVAWFCETWSRVHDLSERFHGTREMRALADGRMQRADVLYIGLAQGLAVSPDDRLAWIGRSSPTGWVWRAEAGIAPTVRAALRMLDREQPPDVLSLPFKIPAPGPSEATP